MSDQFAIGLLVQIVEQQGKKLEELELRIEELEGMASEEEGGRYLDGSPL